MEANRVSGCCGFHLHDSMKARYIPFQCHSSRSQWRSRWFYLELKELDAVLVVPEVHPERSEDWTSKPPLTRSLQDFVDAVSDLRERGLTGYEVVKDFVSRRIQPLQACAHTAFDYTGAKDITRISSRGTCLYVVIFLPLMMTLRSRPNSSSRIFIYFRSSCRHCDAADQGSLDQRCFYG